MSDRDIEEEVRQLRKARSYAAGYRDGLEAAAGVCDERAEVNRSQYAYASLSPVCRNREDEAKTCADAIRALAQQPPPTGGHGAASGGGA